MMQRPLVIRGAVAFCAVLLSSAALSQAVSTNTTFVSATALTGNPQVYGVGGFKLGTQSYAVVCRGSDGLEIVDVTTAASQVVAHLAPSPTSASIRDVAISGTTIYAVQNGGSILRFDATLPGAPVTLPSFGNASDACAFAGGFLHVARGAAGGGGAYEIWNVAATPPAMVFTYDNGSAFLCRDLVVSNNRAYVFNQVSTTNFSTFVFDVATPATATILGSFVGGGQAGAVYRPTGGAATILACTTPGSSGLFQVWEVTNPASAVLLSTYQTSTTTAARNVAISDGRFAGIAYYSDGLRILDLANPAAPVVVGTYDPFPSNIGLPATQGYFDVFAAAGGRFYATESHTQQGVLQGLQVVDFTPATPPLRLSLSFLVGGTFQLSVVGAEANAPLFNLASLQTQQPFGTGAFLGLGADALQIILDLQVPPFFDTASATGTYLFAVPPMTFPPGTKFHIRSVGVDATGYRLSEIGAVLFN